MSKVNGKQKGNAFKRKIANMLSERFEDYTGIEKAFRRNPDSGSFFGGTNIDRKDIYDTEWAIYGDRICPRNFNFTIECKHYKKAPLLDRIIKQDVKDWDEWIGQAKQDAEACSKRFIIVLKYNNTEIFTITRRNEVDGRRPSIIYKDTEIHKFEDVLQSADSFFFDDNEE